MADRHAARPRTTEEADMKKLLTAAGVATGAVVLWATPASAHFCGNASKNPDAGLVEFREQKGNNINSSGTGAWLDTGEGIIFIRNGLHPAAGVGTPDNGIVEIFSL
jgi:hypothetical protein